MTRTLKKVKLLPIAILTIALAFWLMLSMGATSSKAVMCDGTGNCGNVLPDLPESETDTVTTYDWTGVETTYTVTTADLPNIPTPTVTKTVKTCTGTTCTTDSTTTVTPNLMYNQLESNYTGAGTYAIKYYVGTYNNPSSTFIINVVIEDASGPNMVENGWSGVYLVSVDNPITEEAIKRLVTVIDETDGELEPVIESNGYAGHEDELGIYDVVLSATDNAGNKTSITIKISVQDITSPVITGTNTYNYFMSNDVEIADIQAGLSATDNYSSAEDITISVVSDNWSTNKNKKGVFTITFKATDKATNESEPFIVSVMNNDDIKPVISGSLTLTTSTQNVVTNEYIISKLKASDNVDTDLEIELISQNYTGKEKFVGTYQFLYQTTDSSGNSSDIYTVTLTVYDNIAPVIYVDDSVITIDNFYQLNHEQIKNLIKNLELVEVANLSSIEIVEDNYTANYNKVGTYSVRALATYEDGSTVEVQPLFMVNDSCIHCTLEGGCQDFCGSSDNTPDIEEGTTPDSSDKDEGGKDNGKKKSGTSLSSILASIWLEIKKFFLGIVGGFKKLFRIK